MNTPTLALCRTYWGSHGCRFAPEHAGPCECSCCECPDGAHDGATAPADAEGALCVARPPYYGPATRFYGEHARRPA
jgi:hypothetical protein